MTINLGEMIDRIRSAGDLPILDLMRRAGLNPLTDFAGGDWRRLDFSRLDLREIDFRHARLFEALFDRSRVEGADFRGANGMVPTANSSFSGLLGATDWQKAVLDQVDRDRLFFLDALRSGHTQQWALEALSKSRHLSADDYHGLIRSSPDYYTAWPFYQAMLAAGFGATKYALTMLLDKTYDAEEIDQTLVEMRRHDIDPDVVVLNALMDKAPDMAAALDVYHRIEELGLGLDVYSVGILAKKAATLPEALALLRRMRDEGAELNAACFLPVINRAHSHPEALRVITEMKAFGVKPRVQDYNAALRKAASKKEIRETLELMQAEHLQPDLGTFNLRLFKRKNLNEALALMAEIGKQGFTADPDQFTLAGLLRHARTIDESIAVLLKMKAAGVDIAKETVLRHLIQVSPDKRYSQTRTIGMEMNGESMALRIRALITHWGPEHGRAETLAALFPK